MRPSRRTALNRLASLAVIGVSGMVGMLAPIRTWAAWPKEAFDAKTPKDLADVLFKGKPVEKSDAITVLAPDLAENGGVVPITVSTTLKDVESITILAEENPRTLTSSYRLGKRVAPGLSVRVKLAKTQNVTAIVVAQGKAYSATRRITVSVGGCGG